MKRLLPILVVDGHWPTRQALSTALRAMGFCDVIAASNAQDAMRALAGANVGAVIAEWNMPGMSGIGLLRWVRSQPVLSGLPFMLVTTRTDPERLNAAIQAGVSEFLFKPYTVQDLADKIRGMLGKARSEAVPAPKGGKQAPDPPNVADLDARVDRSTVLIVDDVPVNIALIAGMLEDDYPTVAATSGPQAMQIAHSAQPPDLILLDVTMPDMDGYEVCRLLKEDVATRDIPVIFLTGNDRVDDIVRGLEVGAVDYIAKPVEPAILKARIRTHLRLRQAFANLGRQNAALAALAGLREDVERITRHDLKNPVVSIITGVDLLLAAGGHSETHAAMLHAIRGEAWRALDRINQSHSLYRMETGSFVLRPEAVDLAVTLTDVWRETLAAFAAMPIAMRFVASDGGEVVPGRYIAQGEPGLCHSLFGNLLRNAVEASAENGAIEVRFGIEPSAIVVAIHNAGAVPVAIRDRFFEKYVTAGKVDGTGLGTYSAKLVTEAQHGSIAMATDDVGGTTVTVRLPVAGS